MLRGLASISTRLFCDSPVHLLPTFAPRRDFAGSTWLVTFPEGQNHEPFEVTTAGMGGTSPFALVEEVSYARACRCEYCCTLEYYGG